MQPILVTRCLLAGLLAVTMLAAPAAAQCATCSSPPGLKCGNTPTKYSGSQGFSASEFTYSCLGDAGQDCTHISNSLKPGDKTQSCCSCFLYAAHSAHQPANTIFTNLDIKQNKHVLVMPANPCTGVEAWHKASCPGEAIWTFGAKELERANKKYDYGMAINPVDRRGQHQMHVHLAEVKKVLMDGITDVYKSGKKSWHLDCGGFATLGSKCSMLKPSDTPTTKHLKVEIFDKISDPAAAQPFRTVYTSNPSASVLNVKQSSALVVHVPNAKQTWAVVTNPTGPAEKMLEV